MAAAVPVGDAHLGEPDVVANSDADLAFIRGEASERVASRQNLALFKRDFPGNVDIEQVHLGEEEGEEEEESEDQVEEEEEEEEKEE